MFAIPVQISATEYTLFLVLAEENVERIRGYDPAIMNITQLPDVWQALRMVEVSVCYATPEDQEHVINLVQEDKLEEALKFLTRNFAYRPEMGDHDGPAVSIKPATE